MYAVIKTGGKQYRVVEGQTLRVEKIPAQEGASVDIESVLMVADGEQVKRIVNGLPIDEPPVAPPAPAAPADEPRERSRDRERAPMLPLAPKPLAQE